MTEPARAREAIPSHPNGGCVVTRHTSASGLDDWITVDKAEPRCRVSAELLAEISFLTARDEARFSDLIGDVLTIRGRNRTVVYRVDFTDYHAPTDSYGMEWPD